MSFVERDRCLHHNRFEALFERLPLSTMLLEATGRALRVNPAWRALWEVPAGEEVLDRFFECYNLLEDAQLIAEGLLPQLRQALAGESVALGPVHYDPARIGQPGRARWVNARFEPVHGNDGRLREVLLFHEDVTAQVQTLASLQDSERRLRRVTYLAEATQRRVDEQAALLQAISDASADVIFAKDHQGRLIFANPATLALVGRPAAQVLGHTDMELLGDVQAAGVVMANDRRIMDSGCAEELEEHVPDPQGVPRIWLSRKMPYRDASGQVIGLLGISRDITERKRLEQELQASRDQVRHIVDSITDGLAVLDHDWRYTYFNEQGARLLGVRREDMLGGCLWELFPHASTTRFGTEYRRAVVTGEPVHFEEFYPEPLDKWVECHCYPGESGLSVFFRDVTERHYAAAALELSEQRLRRVFEVNAIGMVTGDADGSIHDANDAFLRIVGRTPEELRRGTIRWDEITPAQELASDERALRALQCTGQPQRYEKCYRRPDGSLVPVMVAITRFGTPPEELLAFVVDITEHKRSEEALREIDQRKDEFLATLAHELRNPLAPVRTGLALLRRAPQDAEVVSRTLPVMERQVAHMVRLIDDLLDISRISTGKVTLQLNVIDLRPVIDSAVESTRSQFDAAAHELRLELPGRPVWVVADSARLTQVLCNLLSNAAKYTPPQGRIGIQVAPQASRVAVSVVDNGSGIAAEMLPRVFDMFIQERRALERAQGGLGIGLALVRQLVQMHGGTVTAHSDGPGRGSRFTVELPLAPAPAGTPAQTGPARSDRTARPQRILVVDDNRDAAGTLQALLEHMGHEVRCLHDGCLALDTARSFVPSLVLLDIGLPGRSGYEVAQELNAQWPARHAARLVALTGWGTAQDRQRARDAGFDAHLTKPVSAQALEALLAEPIATPETPLS